MARLGDEAQTYKQEGCEISDVKGDSFKSRDVRVHIEHDVVLRINEVMELNRSPGAMQFTNVSIPKGWGDQELRDALIADVGSFDRIAGLISVSDDFGDYGYVGFFLMVVAGLTEAKWLLYFCFERSAVDLGVASWTYEYLGRPGFVPADDALTDLLESKPANLVTLASMDGRFPAHDVDKVPEIRMVGGCDANMLGYYIASSAYRSRIESSFAVPGIFVRLNSTACLLSAAARGGPEFCQETEILGLPYDAMISRFFDETLPGSILIYNCVMDFGYFGYEHREHGWHIKVEPSLFWGDLTKVSDEEIASYLLNSSFSPETRRRVETMILRIRNSYSSVIGPSVEQFRRQVQSVLDMAPRGCSLVVLIPDNRVRTNGELRVLPAVSRYVNRLRNCFSEVRFASLVEYSECILNDGEIADGWFHYDRMVYLRLAQKIEDVIRAHPTRKSD